MELDRLKREAAYAKAIGELNRKHDIVLEGIKTVKALVESNKREVSRILSLPAGPKGDRGPIGPQGLPGKNGKDGKGGKDGLTPIKGIHYNTQADKEELIIGVLSRIKTPKDGEDAIVDEDKIITSLIEKIKKEGLLEVDHVKGLRGEISSYRNQLALKQAGQHGGGMTLTAGTGIILTPQANGTTLIQSTGGFNLTVGAVSNVSTILFSGATVTDNGSGQVTVSITGGGAGDMTKAVYDPANIAEQLVGLTAVQALSNKTLTAPRFADLGFIADQNGNEMLAFNSNASAVNYIEIENGATGNPPHIRARGDDTNIGLHLVGKGTGEVSVCDAIDETKRIRFGVSLNASGAVTTIRSNSSTARTLDLPNASDTLVGKATTDIFTNKSISLASNTLTGTKALFDAALTDGNFLYVGDITQYTNEDAQDAVGAMVANSTFVSLTYNDGTPSLTPALSATGTPDSTTFLRGDNTWAVPPGGGSGIVRSITVTSGNATAGSTAGTDYVYVIVGAHTITLPTAVGNTNLYTFKNNHSAEVSLATTSSQTVDGNTAPVIRVEQSISVISDGTNWTIV